MIYKFNASLFRILSQVLNVTKRDIAKAAEVYPSAVNYWTEDLPLSKLIKICDHFRIPISYFICPENEMTISINISDFICPAKDYRPTLSSLSTLYDKLIDIAPLSIRQVAKLLDVNPQTVINYWKNGTIDKISTKMFLNIINSSYIYPGSLISCPNRPITLIPTFQPLSSYNPYAILKSLPTTTKSYTTLKKENETLNLKVKNLEERIRELEDHIYYSIPKASEP